MFSMFDFNNYTTQTTTAIEPDQAFLSNMAQYGLNPKNIIADGKIHRFDIEKRGDKAGWYVFYPDKISAGSFGDWRNGSNIKWCAKSEIELTSEQLKKFHEQIEQAKKQREQERQQLAEQARLNATRIWNSAGPVTLDHAYLKNKSVKAYGIRQDAKGRLIVPAFDMFGELQTLEKISPDGKKRFLFGGENRGNYFTIPGDRLVCICEGYSTGASIHEATGATVIVAFNAGNLLSVAENIKSKYSNSTIIICADNDQWTSFHDGRPNPGIIYAQIAADAINAKIVFPEFKNITTKPTDFNDLAQAEGLDVVRARIKGQPSRFLITDWGIQAYIGDAPIRQWLVKETFPLSAVSIIAAMGDAGKGMLGMDLAIKIAGGPDPLNLIDEHTAFGNSIACRGTAIIFTAEDDSDEIHRRFNLICNNEVRRQACKDKLFIIPLPNAGGPIPLITPGRHGPETSSIYYDIKNQLLEINDLKLVIFDPLASFVTADVNADPAVGTYVNGLLSSLATETGTAILVAHHMSKVNASKEIYTAEQARNLIRGTTAIVDGARAAYVLWPATKDSAKRVCELTNEKWIPNRIFFGALVKSNGPGDRETKIFVRNMDTGLLEVWNGILNQLQPTKDVLMQLLLLDIANAAQNGRPFTDSGQGAIYGRREELDERLRNIEKNKLLGMIDELLRKKEICKCIANGSRFPKWLDVKKGPYWAGNGEIGIGGKY